MANEAFALSPISARAAQPSEADYDAIQEAFMETARGRWFLGEYAKRNRNADTKMVLDAVARIEDTLAAQKKPEAEPEPTRDHLLDEALASLRAALTQARVAATAAIGDLALEQNLAPVRKGARVIREIAWRLREIGADGRICDLIDSQVDAIQGAAGRLNSADLAAALHGAFDQVEGQLTGFGADEAMATPPTSAQAAPSQIAEAAPAAVTPAATAETEAQAEVKVEEPAATGEAMQLSEAVQVAAEPEVVAAAPPVSAEPAMPVASEAASEPADAFDANDEALLDMVALEMAAPDTDAAYEPKLEELQASAPEAFETPVEAPQARAPQAAETSESASYEIDVTFPESSDMAGEPITAAALPEVTPLQPEAEPEPEPTFAPEKIASQAISSESSPSLGSSLLANGIVPQPRMRHDPLAPIRRMTQTEKIAFFS